MSGFYDPDAAASILAWQLNHGVCPRCREHKFIGHGPLCVDCYLGKDEAREIES